MGQVALVVKIVTADKKRDEFMKLIESVVDAVRDEPGTVIYSLHADDADENVIWAFEYYSDEAGYDAHATGPASQALQAIGTQMSSLLAAPPEIHKLTPGPSKGLTN